MTTTPQDRSIHLILFPFCQQASHVLNCWLMCIPSQVSQDFRGSDQQITYLLRALGALRLLRSQHRIVPDEAGYRW